MIKESNAKAADLQSAIETAKADAIDLSEWKDRSKELGRAINESKAEAADLQTIRTIKTAVTAKLISNICLPLSKITEDTERSTTDQPYNTLNLEPSRPELCHAVEENDAKESSRRRVVKGGRGVSERSGGKGSEGCGPKRRRKRRREGVGTCQKGPANAQRNKDPLRLRRRK